LVSDAARATSADDFAATLADRSAAALTADTLTTSFAPLARFARRDVAGKAIFSDDGIADGHVRHAQASFDLRPPAPNATGKSPLFFIALQLTDEPDFTFEGLASGLEHRLGAPDESSGREGAVFRTWHLKAVPGRTLTVAQSQASDNGDPITVVQIVQDR
jgi:hypothetical protein